MPQRRIAPVATALLLWAGLAVPAGADAPAPATGELAATGSDVAFWLGVVAVLVLLGGTLVLVARRHRADADA